jgi:hypothetical protein
VVDCVGNAKKWIQWDKNLTSLRNIHIHIKYVYSYETPAEKMRTVSKISRLPAGFELGYSVTMANAVPLRHAG